MIYSYSKRLSLDSEYFHTHFNQTEMYSKWLTQNHSFAYRFDEALCVEPSEIRPFHWTASSALSEKQNQPSPNDFQKTCMELMSFAFFARCHEGLRHGLVVRVQRNSGSWSIHTLTGWCQCIYIVTPIKICTDLSDGFVLWWEIPF